MPRFQAVDNENGRRVLVGVDADGPAMCRVILTLPICDPEDCEDAISRVFARIATGIQSQVEVEVTALSEAG